VVGGTDDRGGVHACVDPMSSSRVNGDAPSSDPVNCIYLLKKLL
jgi:hypothetical protein